MQTLKTIIPPPLRSLIWQAREFARRQTGWLRALPDFLIIGVQRGGTTTLHNYLMQHPNIAKAAAKEIHYFDLNYDQDERWYRSHFITCRARDNFQAQHGQPLLSGEATPYYIYHPHVPVRVERMLPWIKLIVLLRNPVDRAYSHYYHEVRKGRETASSFTKAIEMEEERLRSETGRLGSDETYYSYEHHRFSYLDRGVYFKQLRPWLELFPREQLLILSSEYFYQETAAAFREVTDFLQLPPWHPPQFKRYNEGNNPQLDPAIRQELTAYFQPYNTELNHLLDTDFAWN